jgi:hypothetical protein
MLERTAYLVLLMPRHLHAGSLFPVINTEVSLKLLLIALH